ncbi:hypothetical protein QOZ88_04115 [Blastococcus sp. BMG 814]|uniref:Uncharacterized protein n=1 Tax=Blastococcus carthaginiensis TaxID=3050034 RepID=A0ABT9I999_9ACTN|nr:hypothetical protein [Blastococcus carthaginiensis]MDP5181812.1 hypothetical protein [Blastococcus carthaginiensis]
MRAAAERAGLRAAPWLLWFGVLGGGIAWTLHTVVDWGLEETVCRSGNDDLLGLPLRPVLGVLSLLFLALAVASTVVAYVLWRRLSVAPAGDDLAELRRGRASFMALVGLVADVLFTLMVLMSSVAVLVIPVCVS